MTNAAIRAAIGRVIERIAVVWSPRPSSTPASPVPTPSRVGIDIQLRTSVAVPSVLVQPRPSPLPQLTAAITVSDTAASSAAAARTARAPAPQRRASAIPTNPSASSDGTLIIDDSAISAVPATSHARRRPRSGAPDPPAWIPRNASSRPASIRPSISASLWMPATRWNSSSGFAAPSHNAVTDATPQRRASRGSAHTIRATPPSASNRCRKMPATMFSPVRNVIRSPSHRNAGPYGAEVSRQMFGTVRVSTWSTPRAPAGPIAYGSSPRAAISLCARYE